MATAAITRFRDLGEVARGVRQARGLTQEELAHRLGFSRDYLRALEQGKPTYHLTRLVRLLRELGIQVSVTYSLEADTDES